MRRPRHNHTAAFKAKVAIAALMGDEPLAALAESCHPRGRSTLEPDGRPTHTTRPLPTLSRRALSGGNAAVTCLSATNLLERQLPDPATANNRPIVVVQAIYNQTFNGPAHQLRIAELGKHPVLCLSTCSSTLQTHGTHYSASNAHAVSSPVPVGCTNPCRANIPRSSGLVDTGVNHAHPGCAYANAGYNPDARSADTGCCYWAHNTSLGYANGLAINDGARGYGGAT